MNTVLVVDDIGDWRATLRGLLEDEGFQVKTADSSAGALELAKETDFDVAILDLRLDETDEDNREGLILAEKLKEMQPHLPIIILSGYIDQSKFSKVAKQAPIDRPLITKYVPKHKSYTLVEVVHEITEQPFKDQE